MQREHGVIAGMVRIMHCGAINGVSVLSQCEVIGNRNRFAMRDQETVIRACQRCPTAHARSGAGTIEINGCVTTKPVTLASLRPVSLVTAPSELRRLKTLAYEAIDRPGIDKFIALFTPGGSLGISFGNMNGLYIKTEGQLGPFPVTHGFFYRKTGIG